MIVQVSDNIFWGFRVEVDENLFDDRDVVAKHVTNKLRKALQELNLLVLVERLKEKKFHIHYSENNVTYLCCHDHSHP